MKQRLSIFMIAALAVLVVGCGGSDDEVIVNPGSTGGGGNVVATTFLRLAHFVPAGQNYDVYVNDRLVLSNLTFGQFTDYLAVATNARVEVTQAGNRNNVRLTRTLTGTANGYGTLALTGTSTNILGVVFADAVAVSNQQSSIRLVNASQDSFTITLTQPNSTVVVGSVTYPDATNYAQVAPGTYDLQVRDGSNNVIATETGVVLEAGVNFSAYFYGTEGTNTQQLVVVADLTTQGRPG
jgi:uncharacterized protein DUF4397